MMGLLIIPFLFFGKLRACCFPDGLSPVSKFNAFRLFLSVIDSLHKLKGTVARNPIVACLMFEKLEVFMSTSPGFGTDQNGR
jgi:hypothetical protein